MRIWRFIEGFLGCKYLVVKRDGSVPNFPYFVLGARDPWAPDALRAYAVAAKNGGADDRYVQDIYRMAIEFEAFRDVHGTGQPDADEPAERIDDPNIIKLMTEGGKIDLEAQFTAGIDEAVKQANQELARFAPDFAVSYRFQNAGLNTVCLEAA
jgi:hypothetical protein